MAESGFDTSWWQSGAYTGGGGFTFGLTKLTEGVGFKDQSADRHLAAFLQQGLDPGGYHFGRPDLNPGTMGAYAEADWFWSVASSYGGARGLLLALDAESAGGSLAWCDDFQGRLSWRAGGYNPWFYSYWAWMLDRGIVGSDLLVRDPVWFAWPTANGPLPAGLAVAMQQWGVTSVPGITGDVDANSFFGSIDQLRALTVGGATGGSFVALTDAEQAELLARMRNAEKLLIWGPDGPYGPDGETIHPRIALLADIFNLVKYGVEPDILAAIKAAATVAPAPDAEAIATSLEGPLAQALVAAGLQVDTAAVAKATAAELGKLLSAG